MESSAGLPAEDDAKKAGTLLPVRPDLETCGCEAHVFLPVPDGDLTDLGASRCAHDASRHRTPRLTIRIA
jgi:hypothetical protein